MTTVGEAELVDWEALVEFCELVPAAVSKRSFLISGALGVTPEGAALAEEAAAEEACNEKKQNSSLMH